MDADLLLIKKMKQGDETAFDAFVHKYYREILSYCGYHCADKGDAEDMTQETFLRFFAKLHDYRWQGKTKNYLYTIAGNLCKDYFKKRRDIPVEESDFQERAEFAVQPMETALERLAVEWALEQLPNELTEVIILYYFQDLKLREIAAVLHISVSLAKYRLRQAKKKLGELLGTEG